jgi:hypothetical protein
MILFVYAIKHHVICLGVQLYPQGKFLAITLKSCVLYHSLEGLSLNMSQKIARVKSLIDPFPVAFLIHTK